MIEIVFLGTSSMVPTKERNHSGILLRYKNDAILVDCGEGTQRQLTLAGISASKITKILITHWHGDHTLGLPGLLQTLAANGYEGNLEIYGPKGSKEKFKYMFKAFEFDQSQLSYSITEIEKGKFFDNDNFFLECLQMEHSVPCLGFSFVQKDKRRVELQKAKKSGLQEGPLLGKLQDGKSVTLKGKKIKPDEVTYIVKGKKVTFILDTLLCKNAFTLAKGADLLVSESTYTSDLEEKGRKYGHMTAQQAASIANKSGVQKLILTHLSARYKDGKEVEDDARDLFENVVVAYDLMKVKV